MSARIVRSLFVAVACVGALAAGCAPALALPPEGVRWLQVDTKHFRIYSTATRDRTIRVGQDLERFREALERVLPGRTDEAAAGQPELPTYVFVFGSTKTFEPYNKRTRQGTSAGAAGFFVSLPLANVIAIDASPRVLYRLIVHHEYVHHHLRGRHAGVPLWLDEGLAEYLSTMVFDERRAVTGYPIDEHLESLRAQRLSPVRWILTLTPESAAYDESGKAGPFYAGSWILVHYLLHGGEPRRPAELLESVPASAGDERAILDALGVDPSTLDAELQRYASTRTLKTGSVAIPFDESVEPQVVQAPREEVLVRLGELLAFVHKDSAEAAEHFRAALRIAPDRADAHAGLGYALIVEGKDAEAAPHFAAAIERDGDDAGIALIRGQASLERYEEQIGAQYLPTAQPTPLLVQAREAFARSMKLEPGLAEGYVGLGTTYVFTRENPAPGIEALETARALLPHRWDVAAPLAVLYVRAGRIEACDGLFALLERESRDRRLVGRTRATVLAAKQEQARAEFEKGQTAEAARIYESMVDQAIDPRMRNGIQTQLAELRRQVWVDRYNEAVRLIGARDLGQAQEILSDLAPVVDDPELAPLIRTTLERLGAEPGLAEPGP